MLLFSTQIIWCANMFDVSSHCLQSFSESALSLMASYKHGLFLAEKTNRIRTIYHFSHETDFLIPSQWNYSTTSGLGFIFQCWPRWVPSFDGANDRTIATTASAVQEHYRALVDANNSNVNTLWSIGSDKLLNYVWCQTVWMRKAQLAKQSKEL